MNNPRERVVGAVVLAAGGSRRLGRPKQLVVHEGRTLLSRTFDAADAAGFDPIVIVLGAHADEIEAAFEPRPRGIRFVRNPEWEDGMGTSIATGIRNLEETSPTISAAVILVCDQPMLDAQLLRRFATCHTAEPGAILVSDYGSGRGPPVLFPREHFGELLGLQGDSGARAVHQRHADKLRLIAFCGGSLDIDTPDDLRGLRE